MSLTSKGIFIVGAKRTPFCSHGGPLRELPASHAFAAAAKQAIQSAHVDPMNIDSTVVGNVNFLSQCDGGKTARYCGLYSGVPIEKPALAVSKSCGTGIQAMITAAVEILAGPSNIVLTGGTELMSSLPFLVRNVRFGTALGTAYKVEDHIKTQFLDSYTGQTLTKMAENMAHRFKISRDEVNHFALHSHLKWKAAQKQNIFNDEIVNVAVTIKGKEIDVKQDDIPKENIKREELSKTSTILGDGAIITAGNSSVPADGAATIVLSNEESLKIHNLKPIARVVGWTTIGLNPEESGLGAAYAVKNLLEHVKMSLQEVDAFEINETFAAETLASVQTLKLDLDKVNLNGGAISMGHPIAATGARMITHLAHQIKSGNIKRGIAASSCGGGQGVAVLLEGV